MAYRITREQLYESVWAEPRSKLAKQMGVSDVWLGKVCREARIPTPQPGYWARIAAGKSVVKPALPPRGPGMSGMVDIGDEREVDSAPILKLSFDDLKDVEARVRAEVRHVAVARSFAKAHPLVAKVLKKDEARRAKQDGSQFSSVLWPVLYEAPLPRRRLQILNSLFLAMAKLGYQASMRGYEELEPSVMIGDQLVGFKLATPQANRRTHEQRVAIEKSLSLNISAGYKLEEPYRTEWIDSEEMPIESQLTDIVVGLIVAGEAQYRGRLKWEEEWDRERKKEAEQEARVELRKKQKAEVDGLLRDAAAYRKAWDIREYVQAVETRDGDPRQEAWIAWARGVADRIDPILNPSSSTGSQEDEEARN